MPWEATNKAHPAPCLEAAGTCSQRTTRNCTHTQGELSRVVVDCTFRKQKLSLSLTLVLYSGSESSLLSTRCACLFCVLCLYVCMITCTPGIVNITDCKPSRWSRLSYLSSNAVIHVTAERELMGKHTSPMFNLGTNIVHEVWYEPGVVADPLWSH